MTATTAYVSRRKLYPLHHSLNIADVAVEKLLLRGDAGVPKETGESANPRSDKKIIFY